MIMARLEATTDGFTIGLGFARKADGSKEGCKVSKRLSGFFISAHEDVSGWARFNGNQFATVGDGARVAEVPLEVR